MVQSLPASCCHVEEDQMGIIGERVEGGEGRGGGTVEFSRLHVSRQQGRIINVSSVF